MMLKYMTTEEMDKSLSLEENVLEYDCMDCHFVTNNKSTMAKHREKQHNPVDFERVMFACIDCLDEFNDDQDFNAHVKTHETISEENLYDLNQYDLDELKIIVHNDILEQIIDETLTREKKLLM